MTESLSTAAVPALFVLSLLILAWLSRQISIHIQIPAYYSTGSRDAPTIALFLVFLPGVFVHESAHWIMARLLGRKTGDFRVWPKRQGKRIGLGSVNVQTGGPVVDSLVGMAPLFAGAVLIGLISHFIFETYRITDSVLAGDWQAGWRALRTAFSVPDSLLWAYLLFTIANAMMPSASDRQPLKPVILFAIIGVVLYFLIGLPTGPITRALAYALPTLQNLTSAFAFTILLDTTVLIALFLLRKLMRK